MRSTGFAIVLLTASLVSAADDISVKPAEISERRISTLIKKENVFFSDRNDLTVKLHVQGGALKGATSFGKMKVTLAVDDKGTDLVPKESTSFFGKSDDFREIHRFGQSEKEKTDSLDVDVELSLPPRDATELKALKGEFQVQAGGEEKIVTLKKLTSLVDKAIHDPVLRSEKVKVSVTKAEASSTSLTLEYSGNPSAIKSVEILDASGKKINNGSMGSTMNNKQTTDYSLERPLDDSIVVKLHFMVGQKTVKVPFELHDLKLP